MVFNERLVGLRRRKGLNQKACAAELGVSSSKYNKWENGVNSPDYDTVCRLAQYFKTTTDYLLGASDAENPENQTLVADLGITEAAIENIRECVQDSLDISRFLSSPLFCKFMAYITAYWHLHEDHFWMKNPEENVMVGKTGRNIIAYNSELSIRVIAKEVLSTADDVLSDIIGPRKATQADIGAF